MPRREPLHCDSSMPRQACCRDYSETAHSLLQALQKVIDWRDRPRFVHNPGYDYGKCTGNDLDAR